MSSGGGHPGPRAAADSARVAETIALQQNEAWNNFRMQDERLKREAQQTQQVSLQGVPGAGRTDLGRRGAEFHMGAPGTEVSPKDAVDSLASGRAAANFMHDAYGQFAASFPAPPSSDPLRKYRFVTNEEAHEASTRREPAGVIGTRDKRLGSSAQTRAAADDDADFGMSARQKRVLAEVEKRNEEMTEDLFDDGPHSYARFFKRNLASTAVTLLVFSLLVYTSLDPVASDFILKLSLSSPLNERLASRDPRHELHMVDSEEMAVRGAWWRVESLEGSGKPSTYHNQWDLAGVLFFSDDACTVPVTPGSDGEGGVGSGSADGVTAQLSSESTHHEWHRLPETRPGWGFLESTGGAYINEPQDGGSRVSVHIAGRRAGSMPRCIAVGSCFVDPSNDAAAAAAPEVGSPGVQLQRQRSPREARAGRRHRRQLLRKRGKDDDERATEADPMIVAATVDTVETLPALYGEVEAPCSAAHFPKLLQLAVYDASAEEWTEVMRFRGSEMREVTGLSGLSLRTVLVPEVGSTGGRYFCIHATRSATTNRR